MFGAKKQMSCQLKAQFQQLLDRQHQLSGELLQVEARIEQKEIQYLSGVWTEGNMVLGWHKNELIQTKKNLDIAAKDKRFSLSSVLSRPSLQLSIQDRRLAVFSKCNFQKKKKSKKGRLRGRLLKRKQQSGSKK